MAIADALIVLGIPDRSIAQDLTDRLKSAEHDAICVMEGRPHPSQRLIIEAPMALIEWKTDLGDIREFLEKQPSYDKLDRFSSKHWAGKSGSKALVSGKKRHKVRCDRRMTRR
jgi:hypothetical protein